MIKSIISVVLTFVIVVLAIASLVLLVDMAERKQCLSKYHDFNPVYVNGFTGCLVEYDGKMIPVEKLIIVSND